MGQNRQGQYTLPTIPAVQVSGALGHWVSGALGQWVTGSEQAAPVHAAHHPRCAGQWGTGSVGQWGTGPVGQWGTGSVGQWGTGSVGHWVSGALGAQAQYTLPTIPAVQVSGALGQTRQGQYTLPTTPAVQVSGSVGHWVSGSVGHWVSRSEQAGPVHAAHHPRRAGQWGTGSVGHWVSRCLFVCLFHCLTSS